MNISPVCEYPNALICIRNIGNIENILEIYSWRTFRNVEEYLGIFRNQEEVFETP